LVQSTGPDDDALTTEDVFHAKKSLLRVEITIMVSSSYIAYRTSWCSIEKDWPSRDSTHPPHCFRC